jgi:hypothetical protein
MPYLRVNKASGVNPANFYGMAGDEVQLVGNRGDLLIVDHPKSGKFFCKKDDLTDVRPDIKIEPQANDEPINKGQTKPKKQKAAPILQQQKELF